MNETLTFRGDKNLGFKNASLVRRKDRSHVNSSVTIIFAGHATLLLRPFSLYVAHSTISTSNHIRPPPPYNPPSNIPSSPNTSLKMPSDIPMSSFKFDPESSTGGPPPQLKRVWTAHIPPIRSQYKPIYGWQLAFAIFALQFANMMTFVDSMATPMLMATLSKDLNAASTIV
jgi:hypothetical protein